MSLQVQSDFFSIERLFVFASISLRTSVAMRSDSSQMMSVSFFSETRSDMAGFELI